MAWTVRRAVFFLLWSHNPDFGGLLLLLLLLFVLILGSWTQLLPCLFTGLSLTLFQHLVVKGTALAHLSVQLLRLLLMVRLHDFVAFLELRQVGVCGALQRLLLRCDVII